MYIKYKENLINLSLVKGLIVGVEEGYEKNYFIKVQGEDFYLDSFKTMEERDNVLNKITKELKRNRFFVDLDCIQEVTSLKAQIVKLNL